MRATPSAGALSASAREPGALRRRVEHGVADVQRERELQHRDGQNGQDRADHHELDDRRPALAVAPRIARLEPGTFEIASSKISLSAGPASPQITMTRAAVMRVISTQPGTSPRSSLARLQPSLDRLHA